jgi:hypothetical protein
MFWAVALQLSLLNYSSRTVLGLLSGYSVHDIFSFGGLLEWYWGLNSGLHACKAGTLSLQAMPSTQILHVLTAVQGDLVVQACNANTWEGGAGGSKFESCLDFMVRLSPKGLGGWREEK